MATHLMRYAAAVAVLAAAVLAGGGPGRVSAAAFTALPPGAALPTPAECADRIRRNGWEPRPENTAKNGAVDIRVPSLTADPGNRRPDYTARVSGNFAGTTDELRQFYACKWGLDEVMLGAAMHLESEWRQDTLGDYRPAAGNPWCRPGYMTDPCPESFGITQIRPQYYAGTWPGAIESTSFNLDYYAANQRACYDGLIDWLGAAYGPGDALGCAGWWYAGGSWKTEVSAAYRQGIQARVASPPWHGWAGWPGYGGAAPSPAPTATATASAQPSATATAIPPTATSAPPTATVPAGAVTLTCPNGVAVVAIGGNRYRVGCR
jgi:autotransporter family porin